jgi:predicted transcriptional regulator
MEEKYFDPVTVDILERIVEKRKCTEEELRESPEVIKESQRIIDDLEENGLMEIEQETVKLTEKARILLKTFDELDMRTQGIIRDFNHATLLFQAECEPIFEG